MAGAQKAGESEEAAHLNLSNGQALRDSYSRIVAVLHWNQFTESSHQHSRRSLGNDYSSQSWDGQKAKVTAGTLVAVTKG